MLEGDMKGEGRYEIFKLRGSFRLSSTLEKSPGINRHIPLLGEKTAAEKETWYFLRMKRY